MTEEWKAVAGYERRYEVSSFGRVRSLERQVRSSRNPNCLRTVPERFIRITPSKEEFWPTVRLCKNGHYREVRIKKLVAEAFIPNPLDAPFLIEKDGNKLNCRADNLVWGGIRPSRRGDTKKFTIEVTTELNGLICKVVRQFAEENRIDPSRAWEVIRRKRWERIYNPSEKD